MCMKILQMISKIFGLNLFLLFFIGASFISCVLGNKSDVVEFVIANGSEPETIDPQFITDTVGKRIYESIFDSPFIYGPRDIEVLNGLASAYSQNDDGTIYQFTLREGLVWSDGMPITTEDVLFSYRRMLNPAMGSPVSLSFAEDIKNGEEYYNGKVSIEEVGIRIIDERTIEIELVGPLPLVLNRFTSSGFAVLPKHVVEKYGEDWTKVENIVSNGPFVLKEWTPQDKIVVEKNPLYWDADNVELDRVVFLASEDTNTNYNAYINGELDWSSVPSAKIQEAKLRDDYYTSPSFGVYYYSLQLNKPELRDVRVRKALAHSINKEILVEEITRGGQLPTDAYIPPLPTYDPVEGHGYNVEKARQLLAEAGYPDGKGFPTLTILYNTSEGHKRVAEYVQQEWLENLGINVSLENMEWKTFLKVVRTGDFQVARSGLIDDVFDPSGLLGYYKTGKPVNGIKYANAEYDELLKKASGIRDEATRMKLFRQAESIFIEQDVGIIPIYYYTNSNMFNNKKWEGFYANIANVHPLKFIKPKKGK